MRILVVDDEKVIVKGICFNLRSDGYEVDAGYDGAQAVEMARANHYDLLILDLMMPKIDGLQACMKIREFSNVPIIMLTARSEDADKIIGLESGADDYMTKPFNILELKARVRALLRRTGMTSAGEHTVGELYVCRDKHIVRVSGQDVPLTNKEFSLLCLLLEHSGAALTRDRIMDSVWGSAFDGENRTVDVHVRTLRTKLGAAGAYIETVRGVGYRFTPEKGSAP